MSSSGVANNINPPNITQGHASGGGTPVRANTGISSDSGLALSPTTPGYEEQFPDPHTASAMKGKNGVRVTRSTSLPRALVQGATLEKAVASLEASIPIDNTDEKKKKKTKNHQKKK